MIYLLDTDTCIGWLNQRHLALLRRLENTDPIQLALCSVVCAELLYGAYKSQYRDENFQRLAEFFSRFPSLPFDDHAADEYGQIRADLDQQGTPIGGNDLMIAAIARAHHLILVTRNTSEFCRVSELTIEDWFVDGSG